MGGTPALNLDPIDVKTTRENLKAAIAGEKYERDIMYPEFWTRERAKPIPITSAWTAGIRWRN